MNRREKFQKNKNVRFRVKADPHLKNDAVYRLEKKIVNKYSKHTLKIGVVLGIIIPPYIMYWKKQQMKVSFLLMFLET